MNFGSVARLVFVVFCIAGAGEAEVTLRIRLYDFAKISPNDLKRALDVSSQILGAAGVRLVWEQGETDSVEGHQLDFSLAVRQSTQMRDGRGYVVVRFVRGVPATVAPGALGFAVPQAQSGVHVNLFYDRIDTVARSVPSDVAHILGAALAHELGHALLGSSEHSKAGIMKGVWTRRDYLDLEQLGFQTSEAVLMQTEVLRRSQLWERASAIRHPLQSEE